MRLRRRLRSTLHPLRAYPLRTALALSGIAVGVAAFLVAQAIGAGAQLEMDRAVEAFGTDLLLVKPLPVKVRADRRQFAGFATTLQPEDVVAIAALVPGETLALSGELSCPIAEILPLRAGAALLFAPLARFRIDTQCSQGNRLSETFIFTLGLPSPRHG